jgi:hypothetical protein
VSGIRRVSARRGAWLHLALLFAVTAGVFGMHTLGHEHARGVEHSAMAAHVVADTDRVASDSGHRPPLTDPTDVCIAVLVAALVWTLPSSRFFDSRNDADTANSVAAVAVRGPPPRHRVGMVLADLAVMRN